MRTVRRWFGRWSGAARGTSRDCPVVGSPGRANRGEVPGPRATDFGGERSDRWGSGATPRRSALLLSVAGALSGCGFRPVYGPTADGRAGPADDLAAIEVRPIYERPGQVLREALLGRLRTQRGGARRYDLQVNFWISGEGQGVLNFTQATRIQLVGYSNWVLVTRDAKQTKLAEGSERLIDGFDIFDSQYFAQDLDNEAVQRRLAEGMAERISLRLASWFQQHKASVG